MSKKLIDLDLLTQFKTNADNTYLIKHAASGTIPDQVVEGNVFIGTDASPKDLTVAGDLFVKGTEHIIEVETLSSQSNLVVTNSNNSPLGSDFTGLVSLTGETTAGREAYYTTPAVAPTSETYRKNVYYTRSGTSPNYVYTLATGDFDSSATYYIKVSPAYALSVYDPVNDVIQLGSGTYKSTGEFEFGSNQAQSVATRQDSITDRDILIWDGSANQIKDSGEKLTDLAHLASSQTFEDVQTFSEGIKIGSDEITLTGIDITPTMSATKVVTSRGIYMALSDKQALNSILTSLSGVGTSSTGLLKITNGSVSIDTTAYGTGSVTSVAVNAIGGGISVTGSPITTSGTIRVGLADAYGDTKNPYGSKTANYVLAAPNGNDGVPFFRKLAKADLPPLGAGDVGALPSSTKYGKTLFVSGTSLSLKDQAGTVLSTVTTQDTTYSIVAGNAGTGDSGLIKLSGATVSTQSQTTKFMREDGTWAAPSYSTIPTNYVTTDTQQTITGRKTFQNAVVNFTTASSAEKVRNVAISNERIIFGQTNNTTNYRRVDLQIEDPGAIIASEAHVLNIPLIATEGGESAYFVGTKNPNLKEISLATVAEINALFGISA